MSRILLLLNILLIGVVFSSCKNNYEIPDGDPQKVIICGQVLNHMELPQLWSVELIVNEAALATQLSYVSDLDQNGMFRFEIERYLPQDLMLRYGELFALYVHPGDSLFVTLDAKDWTLGKEPEMKFSGDRQKQNENLVEIHNRLLEYERENFKYYEKAKDLNFRQYKSYLEQKRKDFHLILDEWEEEYRPSQEIRDWAHIQVESGYYYQMLCIYPMFHSMFNKIAETKVDLPDDADRFFQEIPKFEGNYLYNSNFMSGQVNYLRAFYSVLNQKLYKAKRQKCSQEMIDELTLKYIINKEDPVLAQLFVAEVLGQYLEAADFDAFEKAYKKHKHLLIARFIKEPIEKKYNELTYIRDHPDNIYDFARKYEHTTAEAILDTIIQTHKNKVIYLDFWTTSCAPCREYMPVSKKLKEEIDSERVAFVYLCMGGSEDSWKTLISGKGYSGYHYYANQNQANYLRKIFDIQYFPTYKLIDAKGNILQVSSELLPDNSQTKKEIKRLINEI